MESVATAIGAAAGLVVIVGVIIGVVVFVRGAYGAARMEALRQDNEDLRNRVKDIDSAKEIADAKNEVLRARIEHLESEIIMLRDLALQAPNVEAIKDELHNHDDKTLKTLKDHLNQMITALKEHDKRTADMFNNLFGKLQVLEETHHDDPTPDK